MIWIITGYLLSDFVITEFNAFEDSFNLSTMMVAYKICRESLRFSIDGGL